MAGLLCGERRAQRPEGEQRDPPVRWSVMLGSASLYNLIRAPQHRRRDRQPNRLRGLEIDDQLELGRLLDREVGGVDAFEDLVHVGGRAPLQVENVRAIDHETAGLPVLRRPSMYRWEAPVHRELCDLSSLSCEERVRENQERARPLPGHRREGTVDLLGVPRLQGLKPHPQDPSGSLRLSQEECAPRIGRMPKEGHPRDLGNQLPEQFQLLPDQVGAINEVPVTFPPGRARLGTSPIPTGSKTSDMTIGIVLVACWAAWVAAPLCATMTSTFNRTRSAARAG